jgi:hypothetical protein
MKSQSRSMAKTNETAVTLDWVPILVTAVCLLFDKSDPKLLEQEPYKRAETDSWAKFGKEIIAEVYKRPKRAPHYSAQANSGSAQALLRHAHPQFRYAHPQLRLKQKLLTSAN